jgi:hypothetical protein
MASSRSVRTSFVAYIVATPLAFMLRWLAIAILIAVALAWFVPDRRLQNCAESTSEVRDVQ